MEESITLELISLTAAELGVDQYTQEELDELYATSDSEWQYALDNYVSYNFTETDETTDEERAAAYNRSRRLLWHDGIFQGNPAAELPGQRNL